jgi:hypothetical protein
MSFEVVWIRSEARMFCRRFRLADADSFRREVARLCEDAYRRAVEPVIRLRARALCMEPPAHRLADGRIEMMDLPPRTTEFVKLFDSYIETERAKWLRIFEECMRG